MTIDTHDNETPQTAGLVIPWIPPAKAPHGLRLEESIGLVAALGCDVGFSRAESIRAPRASHLFSKGILERISEDLEMQDCSILVVDGVLTPIQQRNLEKALNVKVIDRTGLILEIFGLRARTKEGRLQVELARLLYERSRLVRTWTHLERQRGGGGVMSGPGETQLESDRRMLDGTVKRLKRQLEDVKRTRQLQRSGRARSDRPIIALVGYTNSGKSTLFNQLSGASVFAKDMPFATLDPTIRAMSLPLVGEVALVDTVGFITDLPTHLIDSFRATLEEAVHADLIVHVRDMASDVAREQRDDVINILAKLERDTGQDLPPILEAWNKMDRVEEASANILNQRAKDLADAGETVCPVSALKGQGIDALLAEIEKLILASALRIEVCLAPKEGKARAWLHRQGEILEETYQENGDVSLALRITPHKMGQFESEFPDIFVQHR